LIWHITTFGHLSLRDENTFKKH